MLTARGRKLDLLSAHGHRRQRNVTQDGEFVPQRVVGASPLQELVDFQVQR
jgi:hypothetical protein